MIFTSLIIILYSAKPMSELNVGIINPKEILERGIIKLPAETDPSKVIQPNGIDLYLDSIDELDQIGIASEVGDNISTRHLLSHRIETLVDKYNREHFLLKAGSVYKVETAYDLELPEDVAAIIQVRSTLNRNGVILGSGLWDSGYKGKIGATLYPQLNCRLYPPVRFAQIVFIRAASGHMYEGTYNKQ